MKADQGKRGCFYMSVVLTNKNFDREVTKSERIVIVDFWAEWCAPCHMMGVVLDGVEKESADVKICKVNIEEQAELAQRFQIMAIPTLLIVKEGKVVRRLIGIQKKEELLNMVAENL